MFEIRENEGAFHIAEVRGLEWNSSETDATSLRAALARNGVVCVRTPRLLEDAEFQSLSRLFGPIKDPVGRTRGGG